MKTKNLKIKVLVFLYIIITSPLYGQITINYLDQLPPNIYPKVFAPGIVSLPDRIEQGASFSPDGSEFVFAVLGMEDQKNSIYYMKYFNGKWTKPKIFDFVDKDSVFLPVFSPNGESLYFTKSKSLPKYYFTDIWRIDRLDIDWSDQIRLPNNVNSFSREGSHSVTLNGNLYFTSNRYDTINNCCADVFKVKIKNGKYEKVNKLKLFEEYGDNEGLFVDPNEEYLIIQSNRRETNYAHHDLFICFMQYNNEWSKPKKLDTLINTENYEMRPFISPDSKYLFFDRMKFDEKRVPVSSDLHWVSASNVFTPYIYRPISDTIIVCIGTEFKFKISNETFKDINNSKLIYSLVVNNNSVLPKWMKFNKENHIIYGQPVKIENLFIEITATDSDSNSAKESFILSIKQLKSKN